MENQYLKKIIAQTPEDLHIISACCSEGKVNINDEAYNNANYIWSKWSINTKDSKFILTSDH